MYMTQGLHRSLQSGPQGIATIFKDRVRSYEEHVDRIARFAGALQSIGVQAGDRVAILSMNSDRYAEYLLAVPWAGVAVNPVNIRWSPAEVAYSMTDSDTHVLLIDDAFLPMAPLLREKSPALTTLIHCGDGPTPAGMLSYETLVAENEPVEDVYRAGDDLAGVYYTGGTTGFPKGVMLSHTNFITSGLGTVATGELLKAGSVLLHAAPTLPPGRPRRLVRHDHPWGTHVMVPYFEPTSVFKAIEEHKPTDVLMVPTMIQVLVDHPDAGNYDLSSMQRMLYGGSVISEGVLKRAKGAHVMQGYWNKPEATAEALRGGWLHTGDLGYLNANGFVFVVDRFKDMIVTGSENVYSAEVENALSKHPVVASSAVIGVPDEKYGERVHVVVVLAPGQHPTAEELQATARSTLPGTRYRAALSSPRCCPCPVPARSSSASCVTATPRRRTSRRRTRSGRSSSWLDRCRV